MDASVTGRPKATGERRRLTLAAHVFSDQIGSSVQSIRWHKSGDRAPRATLAEYHPGSLRIDMYRQMTACADSQDPSKFMLAALVLCHEIWHGVTRSLDLGPIEEGCVEILAWQHVNEMIELAGWKPRAPVRRSRSGLGLVHQKDHMHYEDEVAWVRALARMSGVSAPALARQLLESTCSRQILTTLFSQAVDGRGGDVSRR